MTAVHGFWEYWVAAGAQKADATTEWQPRQQPPGGNKGQQHGGNPIFCRRSAQETTHNSFKGGRNASWYSGKGVHDIVFAHLPQREGEDGMATGAPVVGVCGRHGPLAPAVRQQLRHLVPARHRDASQAFHVSARAVHVAEGGRHKRRSDQGDSQRCKAQNLEMLVVEMTAVWHRNKSASNSGSTSVVNYPDCSHCTKRKSASKRARVQSRTHALCSVRSEAADTAAAS